MEEQPWLDTIPRNVPTSTRLCSFCRETGHNIVNCRRGYQAANILHQSVLNIIRQSMENQSRDGVFQTIKEYLKLHTMKELKLLEMLVVCLDIFLLLRFLKVGIWQELIK